MINSVLILYLIVNCEFLAPGYLRKAALVIENTEYPVRLSSDEVYACLVVCEGHFLPVDLLSDVLLLPEDRRSVFSFAEGDVAVPSIFNPNDIPDL